MHSFFVAACENPTLYSCNLHIIVVSYYDYYLLITIMSFYIYYSFLFLSLVCIFTLLLSSLVIINHHRSSVGCEVRGNAAG